VIGVLDAALARLRLALKALSRLDFVSAPSPALASLAGRGEARIYASP
jgi:hypothetical protein